MQKIKIAKTVAGVHTHTHCNLIDDKYKCRNYDSMFSFDNQKENKSHSSFCMQSGITLVALIITIIVLLILATVSISLVINNGILDKAKLAVDKYSEGEIIEKIQLAYQESLLSRHTGNTTEFKDALKNSGININDDDIKQNQDNSYRLKYNNKKYKITNNGEVSKIESILPDEYQQVEYIESTGTQYIDTNVIPKQEFKSIIDFETKSDIASDQQVLSLQAKNSKRLYALAIFRNKFYCGYGDWYYVGGTIFSNTRYMIESFFKDGEQKYYINNQLVFEKSVSINNQWDSTLYLFARNLDLQSRTDSFASIKLFSCKMYNDDNLVRDYIPVLDTSKRPCMFDKVEKKCYYNQGTGEFLYG